MSALIPSKNKFLLESDISSIEILRLTLSWRKSLQVFFHDLKMSGDAIFFSPHPLDDDSISKIIKRNRKDLYYLLIKKEKVLGYGILRGWDEGYEIPSLGLAIHPSIRGIGLGKVFINFLHVLAAQRGSHKVRLRVHKNNHTAINLYTGLNYVLEEDTNQTDYLIGFKNIVTKEHNEI